MQLIYLLALLLLSRGVFAQTRVDLSGQSKGVDLRAASYTRPVKTGAALPTSCSLGELYYLTSALPGANLHGCVADDVWAQMVAALPLQSGATAEMVLISGGENPATWGSLTGDVSGSPSALVVAGLQGRAVSTNAPAVGDALLWNGTAWQPQPVNPSGSGVQVLQSGTPVGTQGVLNLDVGFGIVTAASESGAQINVAWSVDPAVVVTHAGLQSGATLQCASAHTTLSAHTCDLTPALAAYQTGMTIFWIPDADAAGGEATLKIGGLAAVPVKRGDGVTNPYPEDWKSGAGQQIWYDGTVFRLLNSAASTLSAGTRPACSADLRGHYWHQANGAGVADNVAVCAKDASESYAWRVLY